jgi:pimeloyl-ACP methyl ester carboxylesterase
MDYEEMAEDVFDTLDDLSTDSIALLGHSMGGKVAMVAALRFPGLVGRLIVADIAPQEYPSSHQSILQALQAVDDAEIGSRREAEEILAQYIDNRAVRLFLLKSLKRGEGDRYQLALNVDGIARCYDGIRSWGIHAEPYEERVLVLRGDRSSYIPDEDPGRFQPWFPNATVRTIPGASHWLHAEAPEAFRREVREYLSS